MSAREFNEWRAYYGLELLGEDRLDLVGGIIAATIAGVHGNRKAKPRHFMPYLNVEPQTPQEKRARAEALSRRVSAALKKKRDGA
jgi:hypothetical protein